MKVTSQEGQTIIGIYVAHAKLRIDNGGWQQIPPFQIEANSVKEAIEKMRPAIEANAAAGIQIEVEKIEKGPITRIKTEEEREQQDALAHALFVKFILDLRGR